jgi:hypothetical protein
MPLNIALPPEGAPLATADGAKIWCNPSRDIVYAAPAYLQLVANFFGDWNSPMLRWFASEGGTSQDLEDGLQFIGRYMKLVSDGLPRDKTVQDAFMDAGYAELPLSTRMVLGHAWMNVVLCAYFAGVRESGSGEDQAVEVVREASAGWRATWKTWRFRARMWVLNHLGI